MPSYVVRLYGEAYDLPSNNYLPRPYHGGNVFLGSVPALIEHGPLAPDETRKLLAIYAPTRHDCGVVRCVLEGQDYYKVHVFQAVSLLTARTLNARAGRESQSDKLELRFELA